MFRYRKLLALGALCGSVISMAIAADPPAYVTAAVQSPARPPRQMARDADNKPADVVAFAGIKPGDKVAELIPGDGFFTYILGKVVGPRGMVYPVIPQRGFRDIESQRADERKQREAGKTPPLNPVDVILPMQHTTDYKNVQVSYQAISRPGPATSPGAAPFDGNFGLPEQVDVVFTTRGYHQLHNKVNGPMNNEPPDMIAVNKAIFRAMKPGGIYVVSDFAAAKDAGWTQTATLNRSEADAVKAEVLAAGFTFDGASGVLANASDDLSQPATGDKTSQFLLRFRKPANASPETKRYPMTIMVNYFGNTYSASGTRTDFYHADGTYQEFGVNDMQIAHSYFDADGNSCMYHEYPADQEGFVVCHTYGPDRINAKVGETWTNVAGTKSSLMKGYVYPPFRPAGQQPQQVRPAAAQ